MHLQNELNILNQQQPILITGHRMLSGRVGRYLRQGLLTVFLSAVSLVPLMAAPLQLPAIVEPASQEHHVGKIIFVELVTPDLAASKQFYAGLFGWTYRDVQSGGTKYAQAYLDGQPVAGLFHKDLPAGEQRRPAWLSFFAVDDALAARKVALQNGAKVLFEPHNVPNRGMQAVFADPQGAVFAVLASSSGDPADDLPLPGEWMWSSLITTDPDSGADFYQKLFNYEVFELSSATDTQHILLSSGDVARASVNSLPADKPKLHPHWLNFVRVEDTVKMTAKVVALGGRVLVDSRIDRHGGKVSVVADPLGAPFGLIEWPDSESKEVSK